jgi:HEAT repeat protein
MDIDNLKPDAKAKVLASSFAGRHYFRSLVILGLSVFASAYGVGTTQGNSKSKESLPVEAKPLSESDLPRLMSELKREGITWQERQAAAGQLGRILEKVSATSTSVADELVEIYRVGDKRTKALVLDLLAKSKSPRILTLIQAAVNDRSNSDSIRGQAVSSLGQYLQSQPIASRDLQILKSYLTDPSDFVKIRAVKALARLGDQSGLPAALAIATREPQRNAERTVRYEAIQGLGEIGSPDAVPLLEKLKTHGDDFVKVDAIQALNEIVYGQLPSISQKTQLLEQKFNSSEWGPHSYWAAVHLINILDRKEPGDHNKAFEILRRAATDPKHREHSNVRTIFNSRCSEAPKFCL